MHYAKMVLYNECVHRSCGRPYSLHLGGGVWGCMCVEMGACKDHVLAHPHYTQGEVCEVVCVHIINNSHPFDFTL